MRHSWERAASAREIKQGLLAKEQQAAKERQAEIDAKVWARIQENQKNGGKTGGNDWIDEIIYQQEKDETKLMAHLASFAPGGQVLIPALVAMDIAEGDYLSAGLAVAGPAFKLAKIGITGGRAASTFMFTAPYANPRRRSHNVYAPGSARRRTSRQRKSTRPIPARSVVRVSHLS